jgi:hypothetical protein
MLALPTSLRSQGARVRLCRLAGLVFLPLIMTGCIDELIGTCCCLAPDTTASVKNRKECTDKGNICTNNNVCSKATPTPSPSPTPPPPSANPHFILNNFLPGLSNVHGHMEAMAIPTRTADDKRGSDPAECDDECAKSGPFCLKVNLKNDNGVVPGVEKARDLLLDKSRDRIATKQFMDIFNVPKDPCARKDTFLTATHLSNSGESCVLSSSIENPKGTFSFDVQLPSKLEGDRALEGENITLLFNEPRTSPSLTIGDTDLNRDFGGIVQRAKANKSGGVLSTAHGCIAVNLSASTTQ